MSSLMSVSLPFLPLLRPACVRSLVAVVKMRGVEKKRQGEVMEKQGNPPSSPSYHQDHGGGGGGGGGKTVSAGCSSSSINAGFQDECSASICFALMNLIGFNVC